MLIRVPIFGACMLPRKKHLSETTTMLVTPTISAPGGATFSPRKGRRQCFSNQERLAFIRNVQRRVNGGESLHAICADLNISRKSLQDWSKQSNKLAERRPLAKSVCEGQASALQAFDKELLSFLFEKREQGMAVSINMLALEAAKLSSDFRAKAPKARYQAVRRWVKRHSFRYRLGTHVSQKSPIEMEKTTEDYMAVIWPLLSGPG